MILQELDGKIGTLAQVAGITQLNDGSWEMLVLKAYLPTLQRKLRNMDSSLTVDAAYNPFEPSDNDVQYWGLEAARDLHATWLMARAEKMAKSSKWIVGVYYSHLMNRTRRTRGRMGKLGVVALSSAGDKTEETLSNLRLLIVPCQGSVDEYLEILVSGLHDLHSWE